MRDKVWKLSHPADDLSPHWRSSGGRFTYRPAHRRWFSGEMPSILLVEHRDKMFARLSADLQALRLTVARACSAAEASTLVAEGYHGLVIANRDLPDESAWLMVSKWRLSRTGMPVWLYLPGESITDANWADITRVQAVLYYGVDMSCLAEQVVARLENWMATGCRMQTSDARGSKELPGAARFESAEG